MILLITLESDPHTDLVEKHLHDIGVDYFRFNTDALSRDFAVTYGIRSSEPFLEIRGPDGTRVDGRSVSRVWYRRTRSRPPISRTQNPHLFEYSLEEYTGFFKNMWVALEHARWMDNPGTVHHLQDHRLQQYLDATEAGLDIPETYYTNDGLVVVRSLGELGRLAVKPIRRAFITEDNPNKSEDHPIAKGILTRVIEPGAFSEGQLSASLRNTPVLFQSYVEKEAEIRLTVVGEKFFPCRIDSQASERTKHDWRRYDFQKVAHSVCELPIEVETKIRWLMQRFGLVFGAIDLILTPDGRYVFLEVNPAGQWHWIETITGMTISRAIAEWLAGE